MDAALRRFWILAALVLGTAAFVALSLMQPVVGTRTDFSVYNGRWNGASDMARDLYERDGLVPTFTLSFGQEDVEVVHRSFAEFSVDLSQTSLVILGPDKGITAREADWLRDFVFGGGRLLIADDFGSGNEVMEAVGSTARFDGRLVRDVSYSKQAEFVLTTNLAPHPLSTGVDQVLLDYPTFLVPGDARVVATTFASAWADGDDDEERDPNEPVGPLPWLATESIGAGQLVIVSDPSLFINGIRPLADNEVLVSAITDWLVDGRRVLMDESHRDYPDPVKVAGTTMQEVPVSTRITVAILAFLAFVALTQDLPWGRWARMARLPSGLVERLFPEPEEPPKDLVARALEKHPEWDENALRKILVEWK